MRQTYEIRGSNGRTYDVEADSDDQARDLETYINQRIAAGDPELTGGQAPHGANIDRTPAPQPATTGDAVFGPATEGGTPFMVTAGRLGIGALQGASHVLDNAAELAQGAYNQTLGRVFGQSDSATAANQGGGFEGITDQIPQEAGTPAGRFGGEMAATTLLTRGLGGPIRQGMGAGALLSEADNTGDFIRDVAIGGAGGQAGHLLATGVGRLLGPVVDRGARLLNDAGVRITPGQHMAGLREFEDKAMSWPFIGPSLQAARRQGFEDFSRAVPRQALETVQARLPHRTIPPIPAGATGQQAVRHTGDQISAVYEDVIPRLQLQADPQLISDIGAVGTALRAEPLSAGARARFENMVRDGVMSRLSGKVANGRQYQAVDTYLERQSAKFGRSTQPDDQMIAEALRDIRATLRNGITRQNGALGRELEAADEAWSMLVPAETAAAGAPRGFFSPAQYRAALKAGDSRVRRRGMARGEVRGQEFAEAGQDVLPQEYPNPSGTSSHEAYNLGNMRFWQGLGANMLYGQPTRNALNALTIGRPAALDPFAQAVAGALNAIPAPQAGAAGALGASNALLGF